MLVELDHANPYRNARAEAYFTLADRLRMGHVRLPDDDLLREELAFACYDDPKRLTFYPLPMTSLRPVPAVVGGCGSTRAVALGQLCSLWQFHTL